MSKIGEEHIRLMIASAANNLLNNQKQINDLNVFPVPDGDTGTNMGLTFSAAAQAVECSKETEAGTLLEALAKAALRSARGNSGVILSQILRGVAEGVAGKTELETADLKQAAVCARDTAYRAVMKPTEGTILTVVREMAEFAEVHFVEYGTPADFLDALLSAGQESLRRTPDILPVLQQAGVVDAGGQGLIALLEGAAAALRSGELIALNAGAAPQQDKRHSAPAKTAAEIKYLYCTEFLINKTPERHATQFMAAIQPKGDCMLVIEDEEIVKVHIHTNHPGYVIEQALKLGELTNLKIDNMKYQHQEQIGNTDAAPAAQDSGEAAADKVEPLKKYGFVAVASGDGMRALFESIQVDAVVEGGQTMNPSTQDLLNAAEDIHAETVFILPNNKNIILAAEQVADLAVCDVIVIPTKNMPEGISAMLGFDFDADPEANRAAMTEMAAGVSCGQITFAARDSKVDGKQIHKGDIMGMIGSQIAVLGEEKEQVALQLANVLVKPESGVLAVYYGADVTEDEAVHLRDALISKYEDLDVSVTYGGQAVYYYIISVE